MAPSAVAGLGLYTTKEYEDGDFICYYSGECVNCVKGNKSKYLMEFDWYNKDTKGYEKWWLDSAEKGVFRHFQDTISFKLCKIRLH